MKKVLMIAAAVGLSLASADASAANLRLRIGAGHPASATWTSVMRNYFQVEVARRVKEATGDTVEWVESYGGSVCKLGECLGAVESGLLDVGDVETIFEPAKLRAHNFSLFVPFGPPDPRLNASIIQKVYDQVPQLKNILSSQYNQVYLSAGVIGNYGLLTSFPWKTPEELKGKKIAAAGPNIPWITPVGAVPVQAVLTEVYTSLQTGVYEGVVMFPDAVASFRLAEVAKNFTQTDFGTVASALLTVNKNTWDGFSPAVQKIFQEVGVQWGQKLGEETARLQDEALVKMKENGVNLRALTPDEKKAWAMKMVNLPKERAAEIQKNGQPSEAIYTYIKLLQEAGHSFPRDWAAER